MRTSSCLLCQATAFNAFQFSVAWCYVPIVYPLLLGLSLECKSYLENGRQCQQNPLPQQNFSELFFTCRARNTQSLQWSKADAVHTSWGTIGSITTLPMRKPWAPVFEKNVTIIFKARGGCTIELLGSDQIHSYAIPLPLL